MFFYTYLLVTAISDIYQNPTKDLLETFIYQYTYKYSFIFLINNHMMRVCISIYIYTYMMRSTWMCLFLEMKAFMGDADVKGYFI